jgi:site-specific DNA-cytosine methylase|nr:MAG TPA: Cytosine specific methyltransferase [Caudoviricetes sp.]
MNTTPIIDMFSGTGQLAYVVSSALAEPTRPASFSDSYGPARKYLHERFPDAKVHKDFRDQAVPKGSVITIGAPRQDLSTAGKHADAERGSGTRSSLIHEALLRAVAGGADLIVAENVPGGHSVYLSLADWLAREYGYRTIVSSAGAWEVGAPHRRERIMLVAARRLFITNVALTYRGCRPQGLLPTPTVVDRAWGLTPEQWSDVKRGYKERSNNGNGHGETLSSVLARGLTVNEIRLIQTWEHIRGISAPPIDQVARFMHWMMGLPLDILDRCDLSVSAQRRLAGNAVVGLQARLMLQRGLTTVNGERKF